MNLQDVIDQLNSGELQNSTLGTTKADIPKIIRHVTLAGNDLHQRFWLRNKDVMVELFHHIETYTLSSRYARTNVLSGETYKYIIDSEFEPFKDDVLKIEKVYNEGGEECFVNQPDEPWSLYTPAVNQIQIPFPHIANSLTILYRASMEPIIWEPTMDLSEVTVEIPDSLLWPVCLFVAGRTLKEGRQEAVAQYEHAVQTAQMAGVGITLTANDTRFDRRGFV